MKIEFVQRHPIGIEKGHVAEMPDEHAARMISEGYALPYGVKKENPKKKGKKGKKKVK